MKQILAATCVLFCIASATAVSAQDQGRGRDGQGRGSEQRERGGERGRGQDEQSTAVDVPVETVIQPFDNGRGRDGQATVTVVQSNDGDRGRDRGVDDRGRGDGRQIPGYGRPEAGDDDKHGQGWDRGRGRDDGRYYGDNGRGRGDGNRYYGNNDGGRHGRHGRHDGGRDNRWSQRGWDRRDWRRSWNTGWSGSRYRSTSRYYYPRGFAARSWSVGVRLPSAYYAPNYYIDYRTYGLAAPPWGCNWVRIDGDLLLVELATGEVLDILNDFYY